MNPNTPEPAQEPGDQPSKARLIFGDRLDLKPGEENPLATLAGVLDGRVDEETFARLVEEFGTR